MVMSREQTVGLNHTLKVVNSSIERVEEFKYLGITLTNQNSIQKEIKSRLKLGNGCYHTIFRKWEGVVGTGWSWLGIGTGGARL